MPDLSATRLVSVFLAVAGTAAALFTAAELLGGGTRESGDEVRLEAALPEVIALGGGSGGSYSHRFGGRRNLKAVGGRGRVAGNHRAPEAFGFRATGQDPRCTFSVDVDTAAYALVRRAIGDGKLPSATGVRVEELLNYFRYDDPAPTGDEPFAVHVEVASCPWQPAHRLARVGLKTTPIDAAGRPPVNLVFLIDVSGSMRSPSKLPRLVRALHLLVSQLDGGDRVALVTYAGRAGVLLPPTACTHPEEILRALEGLRAGGSTAGEAGIRLAYSLAREHAGPGLVSRVLLATDGDFNVGVTDPEELVELVRAEAEGGVALTTLGFGEDLDDGLLEALADRGDGNYAYIDSLAEARKVLVAELGATLVTVAEDVKLQVTFDPARYRAHRLVGYENRRLEHADFEDDAVDAGEIGAGHGVTALFELVPLDVVSPAELADPDVSDIPDAVFEGPGALRVDVRFQPPGGGPSALVSFSAEDRGAHHLVASDDFRFAAAVAWFGQWLRASERDLETLNRLRPLAATALGPDEGGLRAGFVELADQAWRIAAGWPGTATHTR